MERLWHFPDPERADSSGLVAITPSMNTRLLLEAYRSGIFPWSDDPVRWYSPNPRAIFLVPLIELPKKLGKMVRRGNFRVTFDIEFEAVITACRQAHQGDGEWITPTFVKNYTELYRLGHAHCVAVWQDERLVGGLYGVQQGAMFAGESMFHRVSNASKVAFAYLVTHLKRLGVVLLDAQVINEHTHQLGAMLVYREDYLRMLREALNIQNLFEAKHWPGEPDFDLGRTSSAHQQNSKS
jgi:leucyl/phenylalanyl-tRNA---protein transferase